MTKYEFLEILKTRMSVFPESESQKWITFYSESIDDRIEDGMEEEKAIEALGDINAIVHNIELEMPLTSLMKQKVKANRERSGNKTLWMVLAICGFPIWLPLMIAFFAIILSVYIVIWAVIISFYAVVISFALGFPAGLFAGILHFAVTSPAVGLMIIGCAVACLGIFFITLKPVIWLSKQTVILTVFITKKVKGLFVSERRNEI